MDNDDEDTESMIALAQGHDEALTQIMMRWREPIASFLYRTISDYETANDLTQEVFVRLYRNRKTFKPGHKFSSYLFMIASNLAKNHFRWKKRHPETHLDRDWGSNVIGEKPEHSAPPVYLEKSEQSERVRAALHSVPEKLRIPLVLYYFEEFSYSEIANILNCSTKSVETRIYRGKKRLKELLEQEETES